MPPFYRVQLLYRSNFLRNLLFIPPQQTRHDRCAILQSLLPRFAQATQVGPTQHDVREMYRRFMFHRMFYMGYGNLV